MNISRNSRRRLTKRQVLTHLRKGLSPATPDIWEALQRQPMPSGAPLPGRPVKRKRIMPALACACLLLAAVLTVATLPAFSPTAVSPSGGGTPSGRTAPLVVTAYGLTGRGDGDTAPVPMEEGADILLGAYSPLMSSVPGFPFAFSHPGAGFEIRVDAGALCQWENEQVTALGDSVRLSGGGTLYWSPVGQEETPVSSALLEFLIREEGAITGAGWIRISCGDGSLPEYSARLLTAVYLDGTDTASQLDSLRKEILTQNRDAALPSR